jgi:hypothetical protein
MVNLSCAAIPVATLVRRLRNKARRPSSETGHSQRRQWKGRAKSAGQDTGTNRFAILGN